MAWIKRNLLLVVSAGISLCLLGFGGWYLYSAMQRNDAIDNEIGTAKSELERLTGEKPYPSSSNITLARRELERVNSFAAEARKLFPQSPKLAASMDNLSFKVLLSSNIDEMNHEAGSLGVRVDLTSVPQGFTNYYYSFELERLPVNFPPQSVHPLAERLQDIREVTSVLYKSKINRLESVRRAAIEGEPGTGADYLPEGPRFHPEADVVVWPYEFTFHCFSGELAAVMEQLAHTPDAWVIRSLTVDPAEPLKPVERLLTTNRMGRVVGPALQTVLQERTLRVVMKLDLIRATK